MYSPLQIGTQNLKLAWTGSSQSNWNPTAKKAFYIRARPFYIACAKYLTSSLPLDNKLLFHLRFLNPAIKGKSFTPSLCYVANTLPQVILPSDVSSLTGECNSLMCETSDWELSNVTHCASVFALQMPGGQAKYPSLSNKSCH